MTSVNNCEKANTQKTFPDRLKSPISILWYITKKCKLNCMHCYNNSCDKEFYDELTDEEVVDIAKQLVECEIVDVTLTGGEPLLRRNVINRILPIFHENKIVQGITTSGFGLTEEDVRLFEKCRTHVTLSLDGASAEVHDYIRGCKGSYDQAINSLKMLKGRVPNIEIRFVLTRDNYKEYEKVVNLADQIGGIKAVSAYTLVERGRGRDNSNLQLKLFERQHVIEAMADLTDKFQSDMHTILIDPTNQFRITVRHKLVNVAITIENSGNILAHPWLPLSFGNLRDSKLIEIWERGLNNCWQSSKMEKYLRGMLNINNLGDMAEKTNYEMIDFYTL